MGATVIGVHDRDVPGSQISDKRGKSPRDVEHCRAVARAEPLQTVGNGRWFKVDAFPAKQFCDRPFGFVEDNQWRERLGKVSYQSECGQMASADEISYERKAHGPLLAVTHVECSPKLFSKSFRTYAWMCVSVPTARMLFCFVQQALKSGNEAVSESGLLIQRMSASAGEPCSM
jgi:hypothetical protein